MLRFQPNPVSLKVASDIASWLASPAAQHARLIADAKIAALEVGAVTAAADTMVMGREHAFTETDLMRQTVKYRNFIAVLDEFSNGTDLFTGQVEITH